MSPSRILIVEDDVRIGSTLLRALEGTGYAANWERDGAGALKAFGLTTPDLVLLDLGLPDCDGLDVCRQMHDADPTVKIMMLTARDEEIDVVVGLDSGALDYITKPFKLAELLARIRAHLRLSDVRHGAPSNAGAIRIDRKSRRVWRGDDELLLRAKEFDLLDRLLRDVGSVVTRETLMSDVWDEHWFGSTKTLDFHVGSLRRKIDTPNTASNITTLRGVGYRFEDT